VYFLHPWASLGFSIMLGPILIQRGYDLTNTLFYVGMTFFGPSVTTFIAGPVVDRFERKYALIADCGLMLFACLLFFTSTSPALLLAAVVLFGIGVGFYLPLMQTYGAEIFPGSVRGRAMSSAWALNRVAAFLVPLALLPLLQHVGVTAVAVAICMSLVLSVVALWSLRPPVLVERVLA
jgi:putative MFS transporter